MIRRRTILTGGAVALAGVGAIVGTLWMQPPPPPAAPVQATATVEIVRGTLRDSKTVTGTLGYGELSELRPNLTAASAIVTWIAPIGSIVARGEPLYRLDGQPTILLYGSVPQHRTLRFDPDSAAPVWVELEQDRTAVTAAELALQLEQARLADADARVEDATVRLADALAPTPATAEFIQLAGAVSAAEAKLGRVKDLSAAQLAPTADLAAAQAELDAARSSFEAARRALRKELAGARLDAVTARVAVVAAQVRLSELRTALGDLTSRPLDDSDVAQIADNLAALGYRGTLPDQIRSWQRDAGLAVTGIVGPANVVVAIGPVHIAAHGASAGKTLVASSPDNGSILSYSGTQKLVTVSLNVGDQSLAATGREVTVTLPDASTVRGTITEIGSVVSDGAIKVTVAIADQQALGELTTASVDVKFESSGRDNVLSVPVTALLAMPEGGFAVEVVSGTHPALVPVDTGLFASGRVEIKGGGVDAGVRVSVPQ